MASTLLLAADVGGTKTDIALYDGTTVVREALLKSLEFPTFADAVDSFLDGENVAAAAFGIPGPVIDDEVLTTNLPWKIRGEDMRARLGTRHVRLMNDLETTAYGALRLPESSFKTLNEGKKRSGHIAVIAAGTGLGQAYLFWDGKKHTPAATEGSHADFAPRDELEWELLAYVRRKFGRVSWERVVSGMGLAVIFEFLETEKRRMPDAKVRADITAAADKSAVVGRAGVDGTCPVCVEAVELFVRAYGAQAGNLALTVMAIGGVFIGGGIAPKLLPKIGGSFFQSFRAKGRFEPLMDEIPVKVILDPGASRLGAALAARELLP